MAALDWFFLIVLAASMLLGAWRGLIYEVVSLLGWVTAFVLARWLALDVGTWLPLSGASEALRYGAGFVAVFIATVMIAGLMATLLKKLLATVGLRPADRALGAIFGASRGVLLLLLATLLGAMTPLKSSQVWRDSVGIGLAESVLKGVGPVLPADLMRYVQV